MLSFVEHYYIFSYLHIYFLLIWVQFKGGVACSSVKVAGNKVIYLFISFIHVSIYVINAMLRLGG